MIITVVCDVLGEENNGTTIAAMNLIRSLKAKGHTVRVVCPDEDRRGQEGFFVVSTINFGPLNNYVRRNGVVLAKRDDAVLRAALDGADVMHTVTPFLLTHAAIRIAKEMGIPITSSFHCQAENFTSHIFMMNVRLANLIFYKILYRYIYRHSDCIHFPTQFICEVFHKAIGRPMPHRVISNGVNRSFTPGEKRDASDAPFTILFTGRYSREKSHRVLIDGVAKSKHRDEIRLIFAGAGPKQEQLERYAKKRLSHPPVFGFYDRTTLIDILRSADLYVHPAEIEIEAISCLEAIACGLVPVISDSPRSATRFFSLTERNRFRCNNAAHLAEQIDYWFEHPEEKQECSLAYLGYAKQFDFEECMLRMEQMIREVYDGAAQRDLLQ